MAVCTCSSQCLLLPGLNWHHTGRGTPDLPSVLLDGTVTGELATIGNIVHYHREPALLVLQRGERRGRGREGIKEEGEIFLIIECESTSSLLVKLPPIWIAHLVHF